MKRVLKWNIPVDDEPHWIGEGPVVHVARRADPGTVYVWTEEARDPAGSPYRRRVRVFGTGHKIPNFWTHVGTVTTASSALVWHVYLEPEKETLAAVNRGEA